MTGSRTVGLCSLLLLLQACGSPAAPNVGVDAGTQETPDLAEVCTTNPCGTCGELPAEPGSPCGTCDTGYWACTPGGDLTCEDDLGEAALNACGGCLELPELPDLPCGTCNSGITACIGPDDVACLGDTGDLARNACRGCGELAGEPGERCGTCDTGHWICVDGQTVICHEDQGDEARNRCGGCQPLPQTLGEFCGQCGAWSCGADPNSVICAGAEPNACGSCGPLPAEPGDACGACGSGQLACNGPSSLACTNDLGDEARNRCGGCEVIPREGEPCGACLNGSWNCTGPDSVTCTGDDGSCVAGFVEIPAGSFLRGSPLFETCRADDEVSHQVTLTRAFLLGAFEVTRAQWAEVMGGPVGACPACPADQVSLFDAATYANRLSVEEDLTACYVLDDCEGEAGRGCEGESCNGLRCASLSLVPGCDGYQLPSEAQWEYAARAGSEMATWFGDLEQHGCDSVDPVLSEIAWSCHDTVDGAQPVGLKAANPWRAYDILGNAAEWTHDGYGPYPEGPAMDPVAPLDDYAVVRGGSVQLAACALRAARRTPTRPWRRQRAVGFRLVR